MAEYLIDNPGMREVGITVNAPAIEQVFDQILNFSMKPSCQPANPKDDEPDSLRLRGSAKPI